MSTNTNLGNGTTSIVNNQSPNNVAKKGGNTPVANNSNAQLVANNGSANIVKKQLNNAIKNRLNRKGWTEFSVSNTSVRAQIKKILENYSANANEKSLKNIMEEISRILKAAGFESIFKNHRKSILSITNYGTALDKDIAQVRTLLKTIKNSLNNPSNSKTVANKPINKSKTLSNNKPPNSNQPAPSPNLNVTMHRAINNKVKANGVNKKNLIKKLSNNPQTAISELGLNPNTPANQIIAALGKIQSPMGMQNVSNVSLKNAIAKNMLESQVKITPVTLTSWFSSQANKNKKAAVNKQIELIQTLKSSNIPIEKKMFMWFNNDNESFYTFGSNELNRWYAKDRIVYIANSHGKSANGKSITYKRWSNMYNGVKNYDSLKTEFLKQVSLSDSLLNNILRLHRTGLNDELKKDLIKMLPDTSNSKINKSTLINKLLRQKTEASVIKGMFNNNSKINNMISSASTKIQQNMEQEKEASRLKTLPQEKLIHLFRSIEPAYHEQVFSLVGNRLKNHVYQHINISNDAKQQVESELKQITTNNFTNRHIGLVNRFIDARTLHMKVNNIVRPNGTTVRINTPGNKGFTISEKRNGIRGQNKIDLLNIIKRVTLLDKYMNNISRT